jgi:hypothetical protein
MEFQGVMESIGKAVDVAGVVAIVVGIAVASVIAAGALVRRNPGAEDIYHQYRRWLGRSILLGWNFSWPPTSSARSPSHPPSDRSACWR